MGEKKTVVISGAARGMGRCIAENFLDQGHRVAGLDIRYDTMCEWSSAYGEDFLAIECDVGDRDQVQAAKEKVIAAFGGVDYLVNDAGYLSPGRDDMQDFPDSYWDECVNTNLTGTYNMSKAFGKVMIEAGNGGSIVNISSIGGLNPIPRSGAYCPTKAAIAMLTKVCAMEWGGYGIRVNAICPGQILTDMNRERMKDPEILKARVAAVPLGRIGNVQDIANTALFLLSDKASYITGETLLVDGGITLEGVGVCGRS